MQICWNLFIRENQVLTATLLDISFWGFFQLSFVAQQSFSEIP